MSLSHHTILLVEDDPVDALLLRRTFDRLEAHPVQVLTSGEAALEYLSGKGAYADRSNYPVPSLLFLDLRLPGLSGFEVLTWIRQQSSLSRLQVVVLTASSKTLDVYRAYELGANSYMVKPIRPEDLVGLAQRLNLPWRDLIDSSRPVQVPGVLPTTGQPSATDARLSIQS
jgi:CheY-like chemotaxis protein